jgi:hypothetical protein
VVYIKIYRLCQEQKTVVNIVFIKTNIFILKFSK